MASAENFDHAAYNSLFNKELDAVLPMVRNADYRTLTASSAGRLGRITSLPAYAMLVFESKAILKSVSMI